MQQSRHQGLHIKPPFGAQLSDSQWVGNVGFAALAILAEVGLVTKTISGLEPLAIFLVEVGPCAFDKRAYGNCPQSGTIHLDWHFPQHLAANLLRSDFAQRGNGGLIAGFQFRRCSLGELPGPISCRKRKLKAIRNKLKTILYGNARHLVLSI
jgi:hypothetical protein